MNFKCWLEATETDAVAQSIVQQFPASILGGADDVSQILQIPINRIDSETKEQIKTLGIVRQLKTDASQVYQQVEKMLDDPQPNQKVQDLVNIISGNDMGVPKPDATGMDREAGMHQPTNDPLDGGMQVAT